MEYIRHGAVLLKLKQKPEAEDEYAIVVRYYADIFSSSRLTSLADFFVVIPLSVGSSTSFPSLPARAPFPLHLFTPRAGRPPPPPHYFSRPPSTFTYHSILTSLVIIVNKREDHINNIYTNKCPSYDTSNSASPQAQPDQARQSAKPSVP